jgi:hypothetical protein
MNFIQKSITGEEAGNLLPKEAYRMSRMAGFLQLPGGRAISDQQTHCPQYRESRKIGVLLFSPAALNCAEEWLDLPIIIGHYCQTHLFHFKKKHRAVDRQN